MHRIKRDMSVETPSTLFLLLVIVCTARVSPQYVHPRFVTSDYNVTVTLGREVTLSCAVESMDTYKMYWMHRGASQRAVLATEDLVVTKNPRISAHREAHNFKLTISNVTVKDIGVYLCQLNTKPPLTQHIFLEVVVPPLIIDNNSSGDVSVNEGSYVTLNCEASGNPPPKVRWRREEGLKVISLGQAADEWEGRTLRIGPASRSLSGGYLCIASNGIPPTVSKRVVVNVNFAPIIRKSKNGGRTIGAVQGFNATFFCNFEAFPPATAKWMFSNGSQIESSPKHSIVVQAIPTAGGESSLTLHNVDTRDYGNYKCHVTNSIGENSATYSLREVTTTTTTTTMPSTTLKPTRSYYFGFRPKATPERWNIAKTTLVPYIKNWNNIEETPFVITFKPNTDDQNTKKESAGPPAPHVDKGMPFFGNAFSSGSAERIQNLHILMLIVCVYVFN